MSFFIKRCNTYIGQRLHRAGYALLEKKDDKICIIEFNEKYSKVRDFQQGCMNSRFIWSSFAMREAESVYMYALAYTDSHVRYEIKK